MNITADDVKDWLRRTDRDRFWLATECGAEKGTVDNWLSTSRGIPNKALRIIESLMRADEAKESASRPAMQNLVLQVEPEEFNDWNLAALAKNQLVTDYCVDAIRASIALDQNDQLPKNGTEG